MTQFTGYLTDEVVEDYSDGIITRREALHRLGLLGMAAVVAVPLLAACDAGGGSGAPTTSGSSSTGNSSAGSSSAEASSAGPAAPAGPSARPTEAITFDGPENRQLQGAWVAAEKPRGAVLVIHENRGLTDHIRSVAGRLASSGYSALALDLLSEEGGTASFPGEAEVSAALNNVPDGRFVADMKAAVGELARRTPKAKIGAVGFCFGGGMVWSLLAAGEPRLTAAAPFYGPLPEGVNATRDAAQAALEKASLTHQLVTFPGAGHAFFNDTGQRYNPTAAASAYQQLTAWFGQHLG
jgi:carboxymethylenebutenolidase